VINEDTKFIIEPELFADEKLMWADKSRKRIFTTLEKSMIAFIIAWLLLVCMMLLPSVLSGQVTYTIEVNGMPRDVGIWEYLFFCLTFLAFGFFMLAGLFGFSALRTGQHYAVTDQRVIIVSNFLGRRIASIIPNQLIKIERSGNHDIGSIEFYHVKGKKRLRDWSNFDLSSFSGIRNPKQVEHHILSVFRGHHHE